MKPLLNNNPAPRYNYKKANLDHVLIELSLLGWSDLYFANDVNTMVDHLYV